MATANFGLPYIAADQAQKHVTHNAALDMIDTALAAAGAAISPAGVGFGFGVAETTVSLSGPSVAAAGLIPDRSIICGVVATVTTAIEGAASFKVGVPGADGTFGSGLGIVLGTENVGVIGPYGIYAETDVIVTATGGDFTAGAVRLTALFLRVTLP